MDNLKLNNGFEISIEDGASLGSIKHIASTEEDAVNVCNELTASNVSHVEFYHEGNLTGSYDNIALASQPTRTINEDATITVEISLRQKSEIEIRLDAIEASQLLQDSAIDDLGNSISELMEA